MASKILPGKPYPLGATHDGEGTNFAVYSENAEKVELCIFNETASKTERERIPLREVTGHVWHCYILGIGTGQLYEYRVHGPYEPQNVLRFNPAKLLTDPYATAIAGKMLRMAHEQGLNVHPEPLRCEVQGGIKGPLAEHQLEKAASFAKEFLSRITERSYQ